MDQENSSASSFEDLTQNENEIREAKAAHGTDPQPGEPQQKADQTFMDILGNGQLTKQVRILAIVISLRRG